MSVINNHNDIIKQWMAVKCVLKGVSPYSLTLNILDTKIGPVKAKTINLWEIRGYIDRSSEEQGLCRPTDTTYSPAALGFMTLSVGAFDKDYHVVVGWFVLNMLALACIVRSKTMRLLDGGGSWFGVNKSLLVFVTFFPVVFALQIGQFSLLVLAGVLSALDNEESPMIAGFSMFMMLLKPTLGVPLLALFPIKRYWRAISFALVLCLLSSLAVALLTHVGILELYRQWFGVGWYYGWNKTWSMQADVAWFVKYLLLATALVAVWLSRMTYGRAGVALSGAFACLWTYTQYYDYVLCLPFFTYILSGCHGVGRTGIIDPVMSFARKVAMCLFWVLSLCSLASSVIVMQIITEGWGVLRSVKDFSLVVLLALLLMLLGTGVWEKKVNKRSIVGEVRSHG
ncbi:MAG: glycosyltransferase 87 family protein [Acidobacteriota bacterium]